MKQTNTKYKENNLIALKQNNIYEERIIEIILDFSTEIIETEDNVTIQIQF